MSWYKCECGHIFEGGEFVVKSEYMGECWGAPAYQDFQYCPSCGDDCYEQASRCKKCGAVFLDDEMTDGYCDGCVADMVSNYKYNIAKCYSLSREYAGKEEVEIDCFLASMFSPELINEVLYRELVQISAIAPVDCTPFIEADEYWFKDRVVEEVKKNENRKK